MPRPPADDPFAYPCPTCPAGKHEACYVERTGKELAQPHAKRVKRAAAEVAAARRRADGDARERITEPRWRRLYAACRLELDQRGDWTTLAAEQLEALVRNMAAAEAARGEVEAKALVQGSMGQDVANPAGPAARAFDAQALALATALKLTPATRGTSAPRPGDDDVPRDGDGEGEEERDELADLDRIAAAAKAGKGGKGKRSTRRRGG